MNSNVYLALDDKLSFFNQNIAKHKISKNPLNDHTFYQGIIYLNQSDKGKCTLMMYRKEEKTSYYLKQIIRQGQTFFKTALGIL